MATTKERVSSLERQVTMIATKVDMMIVESQQQREDIRRAQAEMKDLQDKHDAEMKALQENQDAKMHEMNQRFYDKIDSNYKELTQQLHTNFVQTMLGVGAIMAAIGGLIIATLK